MHYFNLFYLFTVSLFFSLRPSLLYQKCRFKENTYFFSFVFSPCSVKWQSWFSRKSYLRIKGGHLRKKCICSPFSSISLYSVKCECSVRQKSYVPHFSYNSLLIFQSAVLREKWLSILFINFLLSWFFFCYFKRMTVLGKMAD